MTGLPAPDGATTRPGRLVIGTIGLDQHEVGAVAVGGLLTRHGYEVVYLGRFNSPAGLVGAAEQEDADLVGVSVHSWELAAYVDELVGRCRQAGIGLVVGGSVLTETDAADLRRRGVDAVFGARATDADILAGIHEVITRRSSARAVAAAASPAGRTPLAGRAIIITGAAAGLGRAYAAEFAAQGAAVVANDVDVDGLASLAPARPAGAAIETVTADVTEPSTAQRLVDAALSAFGRLDGVVANAGILRSGPLLRIGDEDLALVLDTHLTATFRLLRQAGAYWRSESKAGRARPAAAVLTTSSAGLYGLRGEAAYSAAKAAIAALTAVAADELGRYGVTVNAVAPVARTQMTRWMGEPDGPQATDPLAAEHVAPVVAWLLGRRARDTTGRVIEVGNGAVSVPHGWRPGPPLPLPPRADSEEIDRLMADLLAAAPPAAPIGVAADEVVRLRSDE